MRACRFGMKRLLIAKTDRPLRHDPGTAAGACCSHQREYTGSRGYPDVPGAAAADVSAARSLYAQHTSNNPVKYIDPTGHRQILFDGEQNIDTELQIRKPSGTVTRIEHCIRAPMDSRCQNPMLTNSPPLKETSIFKDVIKPLWEGVNEWYDSLSYLDFDPDPFDAYDPTDNLSGEPFWGRLFPLLAVNSTGDQANEYIRTYESWHATTRPTSDYIVLSTWRAMTPSATQIPPTQTPVSTSTGSPTIPAYYYWTPSPSQTSAPTPTSPWGMTNSP